MNIRQIDSHSDFLAAAGSLKKAYLLLYKSGSDQSECALKSIADAQTQGELAVFAADVSHVRDIHPQYGITTVPSLLEFDNGEFRNVVKGCNGPHYYTSYFENALYAVASEGKAQKSVTVYSTPTCTWCNTLKTHLRKNGIRFHEIDVSTDQQAAEEMTRRSGQRGVPQTDIEGEMVVGFDKTRINRLLDING
ncbi:MAG: glutaredoxin domain-containing protein [Bacteroidales bacterium]|nr:glutaredoxin domain-containing protein [Bacteroidales bacterium]MDD3664218.1 glutaredoxin domain-containing protein [Bacteroidales bacterium]